MTLPTHDDPTKQPREWSIRPGFRAIAAGWGMVALAYTPPVVLLSRQEDPTARIVAALLYVLFSLLPWALATRPLFRLCAAAPLGQGATWRNAAVLGGTGLVALPLLSLVGTALGQGAVGLLSFGTAALSLERVAGAATIAAFFSVPTYAAVIGIGQALVWLERTRERDRQLAGARLDALRAQLSPHFLFNTLGAIGQLAHRDPDRAEQATGRLADVLRTTLASNAETVPLSDEIASVMDHVELHRMLLPGPLDLRLSVAPEAWTAGVPALLLQPLVENAVTHALARMVSGAWLSVVGEVRDGALVLTVANARPADAAPSRGLGLGLANVAERLASLHGDRARLTTRDEPGAFTACIVMPFRPTPADGAEP